MLNIGCHFNLEGPNELKGYNEVRDIFHFLSGGFQLIKQVASPNLRPRCSGVMKLLRNFYRYLKEEIEMLRKEYVK